MSNSFKGAMIHTINKHTTNLIKNYNTTTHKRGVRKAHPTSISFTGRTPILPKDLKNLFFQNQVKLKSTFSSRGDFSYSLKTAAAERKMLGSVYFSLTESSRKSVAAYNKQFSLFPQCFSKWSFGRGFAVSFVEHLQLKCSV